MKPFTIHPCFVPTTLPMSLHWASWATALVSSVWSSELAVCFHIFLYLLIPKPGILVPFVSDFQINIHPFRLNSKVNYSMRSSLIFPDRKKHFDLCVCSHIAFRGDSVIVPFMWLNTLCTCLSLSLDRKLLKSKDIFIIAESSVPRAVFLVYDMYMIMMNYDWSCETYYACVPSLPTK